MRLVGDFFKNLLLHGYIQHNCGVILPALQNQVMELTGMVIVRLQKESV